MSIKFPLMSRNQIAASLLVLLHLLLATAYSVSNPLGEAPDEADHWAYVVYLARERRLPEGPRVTQSKHPPFYHATAAAVASLATPRFDFLRANPDVAIDPGPTQSSNFFIHTTLESWPWQEGVCAFHLARLWSVLLSSATVAAVYGLGRSALPHRPGVALLAAGLAATLPEFAFIGGAVNNDNAAALFGTLILWGGFAIYQAQGQWRAGWWTPLALGFGLLSKVSILSLWPIVALCILLGAARQRDGETDTWQRGWQSLWRNWPRWLLGGLIIFLPALALAAPWLLRNWRLYGDPSGMALVQQTIDLRTTSWTWADSGWLLRGWFLSFWGKFGAVGHLAYPGWVYWLFAGVSAIGLGGLVYTWGRARREHIALYLLALALLAVALAMWRYSLLALGTDQGRLLFPAIGPLLLLLSLGLASLPLGKARRWLGAAFLVGLTLLTLYGLFGVIQPAFAPPPPPPPNELAQANPAEASIYFGELTLSGWTLEDNPILYWHSPEQPMVDWRTDLRVTAEDGTLVWEWRRSPGYGRFSSDHWSAGTRVRDEYVIGWPDWAGPGRYRVEVTLYPFGGEPGQDQPFVILGWLDKDH
ncbi:MAG: glycosyltransferase family 39 protein [Caldilineaceae bacterium]|nr:glycosyltransferase family 39 protein [Caldilineaceae bacterium]